MFVDDTILFTVLCAALNIFFIRGPYLFDYLEEKFLGGSKKFRKVKKLSKKLENYCEYSAKVCKEMSAVWKKFLFSFMSKLIIAIFALAMFAYAGSSENSTDNLDNLASISEAFGIIT